MNKWLASVYEPFKRRDHRSADLIETEQLYDRVKRLHESSRYANDDAAGDFRASIFDRFRDRVPEGVHDDFYFVFYMTMMQEGVIFDLPPFQQSLTLKEMVEFRQTLRRKEHFYANEKEITERLAEGMELIFGYIADLLPQAQTPSPFLVPLIYALPDPKKIVTNIIGELWKEKYYEKCFVEVSRQIHFNICRVSGIANPREPNKPYLLPQDNPAPLHELVPSYLGGTPFEDLFALPVALKFTNEERFSHHHIIGGNKAGKTTLMKRLILNDIEQGHSLVIVDSHNDLADFVSHLDLGDRLVLISPRDIEHPPSINIFAPSKRFSSYGPLEREQSSAAAIQTLNYLFEGMDIDLTGKQGILFEACARFMLAFPGAYRQNATLNDMITLMRGIEPYREAIRHLPSEQRTFFEQDFVSDIFKSTREELRYRLQGIRQNPLIGRLFTASETKVDFFDLLNSGAVIVIDTAKDVLKDDSSFYGRIFLSLIFQAVFERAVLPDSQRHPAFLYADEFQEYMDARTKTLLTDFRKFKMGAVLAHHSLAECSTEVRAALMTEPAIRMAARVSPEDARSLASGMRTTSEFILDQEPHHFACYVQDVTKQALSLTVSIDALHKVRRVPDAEYDAFLFENRWRVSAVPTQQQPDEPRPEPEVPPKAEPIRQEPEPQKPMNESAKPAPQPERTKTARKRPNLKRRGPLVGDIDTSA